MINIGDLLKNYSEIKNPLLEKMDVLKALNEKFNFNIKENQIFFRKNTIILKVDAVQKNFIYIRKNDILEVVKSIVPNRFINNIQF
jgi:hypothetical protein